MFTGIIETTGVVLEEMSYGTNKTFWIKSAISSELKVDQSLSHNGVCLTIEEIQQDRHRVTAVQETLRKSNLGSLKTNDKVNLERCLSMNGRLDGHMVQGHVDATGTLIEKKALGESWELTFSYPPAFSMLLIEKGSISVNGISLTVFNVSDSTFTVAIIPYTYEHTNIKDMNPGSVVNLEFDIIGKYVTRFMGSRSPKTS
jgi:riboflavin synthase